MSERVWMAGAGAVAFAAVIGFGLWRGMAPLPSIARAVLAFGLGAGAAWLAGRVAKKE